MPVAPWLRIHAGQPQRLTRSLPSQQGVGSLENAAFLVPSGSVCQEPWRVETVAAAGRYPCWAAPNVGSAVVRNHCLYSTVGLSTTLAPKPAGHEERTQVRQARRWHCGFESMGDGHKG